MLTVDVLFLELWYHSLHILFYLYSFDDNWNYLQYTWQPINNLLYSCPEQENLLRYDLRKQKIVKDGSNLSPQSSGVEYCLTLFFDFQGHILPL